MKAVLADCVTSCFHGYKEKTPGEKLVSTELYTDLTKRWRWAWRRSRRGIKAVCVFDTDGFLHALLGHEGIF
jgi:hypothetical protein